MQSPDCGSSFKMHTSPCPIIGVLFPLLTNVKQNVKNTRKISNILQSLPLVANGQIKTTHSSVLFLEICFDSISLSKGTPILQVYPAPGCICSSQTPACTLYHEQDDEDYLHSFHFFHDTPTHQISVMLYVERK